MKLELDDRLDELLCRWESSGGVLTAEELCADPEVLPRLRECIRQLQLVDEHLNYGPEEADETAASLPEFPGYEVLGALGRGGMGIVYKALQLGTRRIVALKVIRTAESASLRTRLRFKEEVELASLFKHPNLARVYDSGIHQGHMFYAMELIDGQPIDRYVANESLSRPQILKLMQGICAAVHHAHQLGEIHRDLKPSNILVDRDGQPHVVDFGVARAIERGTDPRITQTSDVPGTPAYMSPEQAAGHSDEVGTASDVYTLGVILYQLLLGRLPHDTRGNSFRVMHRRATEDPIPPRSIDRKIPRDCETVILRALDRGRSRRQASADALAQEICCLLSHRPVPGISHSYRLWKIVQRNRTALLYAAVALLCFACMSVVYWRMRAAVVVTATDLSGRADALHVAALLKQQAGDLKGAEVMYRRSLDALLAEGREDRVAVMNDRAALFQILRKQGRHAEAQAFIDACERLVPTIMQIRGSDDAVWLSGYADALITCGLEARAVELLEEALPLVSSALPEHDPGRLRVLRSLHDARSVLRDSSGKSAR